MNFTGGGLDAQCLSNDLLGRVISPHLSFSWGLAKEQVYSRPPSTLEEIEYVIRDVLTNVPAECISPSHLINPRCVSI